jgi:hypothetical protein
VDSCSLNQQSIVLLFPEFGIRDEICSSILILYYWRGWYFSSSSGQLFIKPTEHCASVPNLLHSTYFIIRPLYSYIKDPHVKNSQIVQVRVHWGLLRCKKSNPVSYCSIVAIIRYGWSRQTRILQYSNSKGSQHTYIEEKATVLMIKKQKLLFIKMSPVTIT